MSKYIETPITAEVYQRCYRIIIDNAFHAPPVVTFEEEQIIKRADGTALHDVLPRNLAKTFTDQGYTFPVYNPATQQRTEQTGTFAQVYALIWSVYMFEATKRDAQRAMDAVLAAFEVTHTAGMAVAMAAAKAVRDAFIAQDGVDLAQLAADIAAAANRESEDACQYAYDIARAAKLAASEAQANTLVTEQIALSQTLREQAQIDAQAAYDAVMAA